MIKRCLSMAGIFIAILALAGCHGKVNNPIAAVDSKQPDKILFDRAMDAMKSGKYDVARLTLQTLINTYPDSEFVARAKLAVGDSWYAEGGSAAMTQAENEYKDFETFFPNMPEAAEAQLKIANIHYREMEKPDRDFTHAMRAEQEYRYLITQYPESKLVPEAEQRLREVQEVLAEREYRIGRFYFMRESYNAAVARLKSLTDTYPLYSRSDDALFMLGECYQHQADNFRAAKSVREDIKARMVKEREDMAAAAFSEIVSKYPAMDRADEAKKMLAAMHYPIPNPTPQALAESKKIEASRGEPSLRDKFMSNLTKGPNQQLKLAAKVGDPTLTDPKQTGAPELIKQLNDELASIAKSSGTPKSEGGGNKVSVEAGTSAPPTNEAAPGSESGGVGAEIVPANDANGIPELTPVTNNPPPSDNAQPATPPKQINEVQDSGDQAASASTSSSASGSGDASKAQGTDAASSTKSDYSTSKQKKKKGLRKLIPF